MVLASFPSSSPSGLKMAARLLTVVFTVQTLLEVLACFCEEVFWMPCLTLLTPATGVNPSCKGGWEVRAS